MRLFPETERSGGTGIMQSIECLTVTEGFPDQFARTGLPVFCEYYMLSRKNPALFQKPSDFRILYNSIHHFFDRLPMLYWSYFNWISEGCDTIDSSHRLRLKRPAPPRSAWVPSFKSSTAFRALARTAPGIEGLRSVEMTCFAILRFG